MAKIHKWYKLMVDVEIRYKDEATCYIVTDEVTMYNLKDKMKFHPKNYFFSPKYKARVWDGYVKLIKNNTMPSGLIPKLCEVIKSFNSTFSIDSRYLQKFNITRDFVKQYAEILNLTNDNGENIQLREHQLEGVYKAISNKRMTGLSATNSGKSALIYVYIRFLLDVIKLKQILLLVPTTTLVEQMYSDFYSYSLKNEWSVETNCQKVYSNIKNRDLQKPVIISTWQSIYNNDVSFFENFEGFICDEVHLAKGDSIQSIASKCINASYRLGVTGSLSDCYVDELVIRGAFGSVVQLINNEQMIQKGYSTPYDVKCILLKYDDEISKHMKYLNYHDEIDFISECKDRRKYIAKLVNNLKNNTLVLFEKIDKQGIPIYQLLKAALPNKKVLYIDGEIEIENRIKIIEYMKNHNDVVLVASYGTFSTGINLRNLYNLIFATPFRSKIRLLQSLGRMLRTFENKDKVMIYDLVDDMSYKSYVNNLLKQFTESRLVYYDRENSNYKIYKVNLGKVENEDFYIEKAEEIKKSKKMA